MRVLERLIIAVVLGGISPIVGLLAGWWGAIPWVPERWIWLGALLGLIAGIVVDALFLPRWTARAETLSWWAWAAIYGFYAVCIYGFFMGVPVVNAALALPAGIIVGCRLERAGPGASSSLARRACWFTTGVLTLICVTSAALALTDASTAANLEGMAGLPFEVTQSMILALILVGGAALLVVEWWMTALTIRWARVHVSRAASGKLHAPGT